MSEPSPLDLAFLARQTFGDRALEREVLVLFDQQCVRLLPCVAGGGDALHTLKGAARSVGAWRIAALAETLETALGDGSPPDTVRRLVDEFEAATAATRAALMVRLAEPA